MKNFNSVTSEEREEILSTHLTTELQVDRVTLNFENIEQDLSGINLKNDFEVPPLIVDEKHLAQVLAFSPQDNKGRWIRTMVRTYLEGGRVVYKKIDENNFKVTLRF